MRIEPKVQSHLQLPQTTWQIPTNTRPLDSIASAGNESAATPAAPISTNKSPLYVVIDLFNCAKFFIIAHVQAFARKVFSCLFKPKATSTAASQQQPAVPPRPNAARPPSIPQPPTRSSGTTSTPPQPGLTLPAAAPQPAPGQAPSAAAVIATENAAFNALPISETNKTDITFIVHTLATQFLLPATELTTKGEATRPVHPLRFLEHILKTQSLAQDFAALRSRPTTVNILQRFIPSMVWGEFSSTLSQKLEAQHTAGRLACHVNAFARSVGRDPNEIQTYVTSKNWMGLINYLIDTIPPAPVVAPPEPRVAEGSAARPTPPLPLAAASSPGEPPAVRVSPPGLPLPDLDTTRSTSGGEEAFPLPRAEALDRAASGPTPAIRLDPNSRPMNDLQKALLRNTISTIAHSNCVSLLWQIRTLRANWNALRDVHPLKILLTVFEEPLLFSDLQRILADYLKKEEFLKDFARTLKHGNRGNESILSYLYEFKRQMRCQTDLSPWIVTNSTKTWKEAILFLVGLRQSQIVPLTVPSPDM